MHYSEPDKRPSKESFRPIAIGVINYNEQSASPVMREIIEGLEARLGPHASLVSIGGTRGDVSRSIEGVLCFWPLGEGVALDDAWLTNLPTVVLWQGHPPRMHTTHRSWLSIPLGDPAALSRAVLFLHQSVHSKRSLADEDAGGREGDFPGTPPLLDQTSIASKTKTTNSAARVAIDVRLFGYRELSERGIGHYVLPHLQAIFMSGFPIEVSLLVDIDGVVPEPVKALAAEHSCQIVPLDAARNDHYDIVHIPDPLSIIPGYDSPLRCRPPSSVTSTIFYDVIPLRIPDQHLDVWDVRTRSVYLGRLAQVSAHQTHLFAISDCTRNDLIELLGIDSARVTTIHAGCNFSEGPRGINEDRTVPQRLSAQHGIRGPFFLMVGAIEKHKNFPLALDAFSMVRRSHPCQLVIVGSFSDPYKEAYREYCLQQGMRDVVFTGFLDKQDLRRLYASATAVLVPSRYEGFGFPALEAMERGSPVIASAAASIPEVVGNAGILLPPNDPAPWAQAMSLLIQAPDQQERYRRLGIARAQQFSWTRNAAIVIETWTKLLATVK